MRAQFLLVSAQAMLILVSGRGRGSTGRGGGWSSSSGGSYSYSSSSYPKSAYSYESSSSSSVAAALGVAASSTNTSTDLDYLGCFLDHRDRVFPNRVDEYSSTPITPSSCAKLCLERGQLYSAVQYYAQCFCSDVPPPEYERASNETECDTKCNADRSQICGGTWRMSVYFAGSTSNQWDKAYHEVSTMLTKINSIRDLETRLKTKEAELERVQAELDEIRSRKSTLEKEISESTNLCSELQLASEGVEVEKEVDAANNSTT